MKKTIFTRLTSVLLVLALCVGLMLPAFAAEQTMPEPTWQNVLGMLALDALEVEQVFDADRRTVGDA